ncbi:uncharacterized protein PAC_19901 [Phialocephala subalpina]|uniref:Zn(2)-C6 fungal-type domain-containing protein n=1 Tax=Phialocephala subalpina TaxID=576137 RepID=A0A1L7XYB6_9HELO|nr:uncharacterized protein PAC_19901 [Phialocephala subalpina]
MVNVGGRSKGCTTCRKRRVKCDEEQPICLRCRKSGLECDGPRRTTTFIVGKVIKSRRSTKAIARDSDTELSSCPSHILRVSFLSSNEFEVYICYALKHLRRGGTIELTTRTIKPTDIVPARTVATIHRGHISHQAILSFAAIFFGTQHRQPEITRTGFAAYGLVLQRLNEALSDPAYNTKDDLIYAVVTLGILELFCTGSGNHLKHMAGLERLFALRDHSLPISYESAEMYRSLRQMIIFAALRSRKPSILARLEWKKQLREHIDSPDELQKQELFDVLADCTVVVSARDRILGESNITPEISTHELDKLKQDTLSLLAQLSSWKKRWDSDEKHKIAETPLPHNQLNTIPTDPGEVSLPFTTNLEYTTESVAIAMLLYNISLIHVLQILALLTSPPPEHLPSESQSTSPPTTPPLQSPLTSDDRFLHDPPHFPNVWSHPPPSNKPPPHPYLSAQENPILDICRSISYHLSDPQSAASSVFHWATATVWIKVRGEESVVGRWVWSLLVERKSILVKTLGSLAG